MDILLYASAIIATIALVLIAIFIVMTYKSFKQSMGEVNETVSRIQNKINQVTDKANGLLEKTDKMAEDADEKLQAFQQLGESAKELEETTRNLDVSFQNMAQQISNPPEKHRKIMEQTSVVTETIARIYYGFKKENRQGTTSTNQPKNDKKSLPKPKKQLEYHD